MYSAERLLEVFPTHFTEQEAYDCEYNPKAIAIRCYGGRMGNRLGTDDGWVHRGKGLLQSTGRANSAALASQLNVDPETAAKWLIDPAHALECACATFVRLAGFHDADHGMVDAAILDETRHINGGTNGLSRRMAAIERYGKVLAQNPA